MELWCLYARGLKWNSMREAIYSRDPQRLADAVRIATELETSRNISRLLTPSSSPSTVEVDAAEQSESKGKSEDEAEAHTTRFSKGGPHTRRWFKAKTSPPPNPCRFCGGKHWNRDCSNHRPEARNNKGKHRLYTESTLGAAWTTSNNTGQIDEQRTQRSIGKRGPSAQATHRSS